MRLNRMRVISIGDFTTMREIRGDAKTIRQLLSGAKYAIDYYQREYRWEKKQVQELIDDLSDKFLRIMSPPQREREIGHAHAQK
jgi:uncharacterized protein with ParB-like and HNH nuclease domain